MGDQPVINTLLPDAIAAMSSRTPPRRVLCGGLFGMRGAGKAGALDFVAADVVAQAAAREKGESVLS